MRGRVVSATIFVTSTFADVSGMPAGSRVCDQRIVRWDGCENCCQWCFEADSAPRTRWKLQMQSRMLRAAGLPN